MNEALVTHDELLWARRKPFPAYSRILTAILLCNGCRSPRTASIISRSATLHAVVRNVPSQERCELSDKIRPLYGPCRKVRFYVTLCEISVKLGKINSIEFGTGNLKKNTPLLVFRGSVV
jgi:hypothetical protein